MSMRCWPWPRKSHCAPGRRHQIPIGHRSSIGGYFYGSSALARTRSFVRSRRSTRNRPRIPRRSLHGGYRWGRIYCSHTHCKGRQQEDFIRALGTGPREVWRGQAGGSAPYDDLPPVESYDEAAQEGTRRHTPGAKASPTGGEGGVPARQNEPPSYPEIPPLDALRIDHAELGTARLTPTCVVESYLYADVAVLAGPGGTGKTTLALWEAAHIALGRPLYGLTVHTPGAVALITGSPMCQEGQGP
jgi:hypothetical protein